MINQKGGGFRKESLLYQIWAGEQIFFVAKEEILFKCKTSQITINQMIDIAGKEVRIN